MTSLNIKYSVLQFCFWFLFGTFNNFASVYLLDCGLSNMKIGIMVALSCMISVILQPVIATYADRKNSLSLKEIILCFVGTVAILSAVLAIVYNRSILLVTVIFGLAIIMIQSTTPLLNAMAMEMVNQGKSLNFSLARGFGSIGYAVMSYSLGILIDRLGVRVQPVGGLIISIIFFISLMQFPFIKDTEGNNKKAEERHLSSSEVKGGFITFIKKYRWFSLALIGFVFIYISHVLINNYVYQIVVSKGGGSSEMGIATAIASASEIIIMFIFSHMLKVRSAAFWFRIAGIFFALKTLGTLLAGSVQVFYLVQFFQPMGWGLLTVSSVYYINSIMEEADKVKGQAYMTMTYSIASIAGAALGGVMLDLAGVNEMLFVATICAMAGSIVVLFSIREKRV